MPATLGTVAGKLSGKAFAKFRLSRPELKVSPNARRKWWNANARVGDDLLSIVLQRYITAERHRVFKTRLVVRRGRTALLDSGVLLSGKAAGKGMRR